MTDWGTNLATLIGSATAATTTTFTPARPEQIRQQIQALQRRIAQLQAEAAERAATQAQNAQQDGKQAQQERARRNGPLGSVIDTHARGWLRRSDLHDINCLRRRAAA